MQMWVVRFGSKQNPQKLVHPFSTCSASSVFYFFFFVMILSSRYYREFIFIHYSYVTFYACSFPYNNIHTYIMYIFRVNISIYKCSYNSILLYSYLQYSHENLLLLSNFELLLSNFQLLLSDFELLLFDFSNCYCLTFPTITV